MTIDAEKVYNNFYEILHGADSMIYLGDTDYGFHNANPYDSLEYPDAVLP